MHVEEEENRVKMDKQRLALTENKNINLEKELNEAQTELKEIKRKHDKLFTANAEMKDQLRVLNENLRRETEVLLSRDKENATLSHENKVLKELLDEHRDTTKTNKEDQEALVENLRL